MADLAPTAPPAEDTGAAAAAADEPEDEVDLLCIQILRRLNQLKQRKAADIALKTLCDATIAELEERSKEVKSRAFKREQARDTYTETIAETEVAMQKVIATADVVANVLNDDVAQDDQDDLPEIMADEMNRPGAGAGDDGDDQDAENAKKAKRRKKRKAAAAAAAAEAGEEGGAEAAEDGGEGGDA